MGQVRPYMPKEYKAWMKDCRAQLAEPVEDAKGPGVIVQAARGEVDFSGTAETMADVAI